jgi:hypothetical protein
MTAHNETPQARVSQNDKTRRKAGFCVPPDDESSPGGLSDYRTADQAAASN